MDIVKQKGSRFTIICYIIMAIACVTNGSYSEAFSVMSAAYALECCSNPYQVKLFYTLAALGNLPSMRFVGVLGYLFAALGKPEISNPLLALHYGLVGIDDSEISIVGRVASGGIGLSFAL
jgi:hypothetical protein